MSLRGIGDDGETSFPVKIERLSVHGRNRTVFYRISVRNGEAPHALVAHKAGKAMFGCVAHGRFNALHAPVRTSEIANFPLLYLAVERFENFCDRALWVIPM